MEIGLTGGIATGKSTVSSYLRELGALVIDVDKISREIAKRDDVLAEIKKEFGDKSVENGRLNRDHIRKVVFSDTNKRESLNGIMHPKILNEVRKNMKIARCKRDIIFIDMPLLFEVNFDKEVSKKIVITCDKSVQVKRLIKRDKIDEGEALKTMGAQMDLREKERRADYIIKNNSGLEDLKKKVEIFYQKLLGEME